MFKELRSGWGDGGLNLGNSLCPESEPGICLSLLHRSVTNRFVELKLKANLSPPQLVRCYSVHLKTSDQGTSPTLPRGRVSEPHCRPTGGLCALAGRMCQPAASCFQLIPTLKVKALS